MYVPPNPDVGSGHLSRLQGCSSCSQLMSVLEPVQPFDLTLVPPPHVLLQEDHWLHSPFSGSAAKQKKKKTHR